VEASHHLILLGSVLVLLSIFAGVFSARFGAPLLLVFLGLGILAGEEGPGGILFRDFHAAYLIGSIALAIILFDGGLRTDPKDVRRALWPSLALATIGVIVTAAIVGAAAALLFSTSWTRGLLIGAIVAPTDAAAVSALLHLRRLELRARVAAILEIESGINDPISVLLAVLLVNLLVAPAPCPYPTLLRYWPERLWAGLPSASAAAICCSLSSIAWRRVQGCTPFWRLPVVPPSSAPPRQLVQAGF
jgi:cell volume regulation protein A